MKGAWLAHFSSADHHILLDQLENAVAKRKKFQLMSRGV
jgi:hypothetical protein